MLTAEPSVVPTISRSVESLKVTCSLVTGLSLVDWSGSKDVGSDGVGRSVGGAGEACEGGEVCGGGEDCGGSEDCGGGEDCRGSEDWKGGED